MKAIETQGIITGVRSKVDGSLGLSMSTPELTSEEKAAVMDLQGQNLVCTFVPLDEKNAPKMKVDKEIETKTPSNRLRNVLYVLWEQEGGKGDFDDFYKRQMEKVIDAYKGKLL